MHSNLQNRGMKKLKLWAQLHLIFLSFCGVDPLECFGFQVPTHLSLVSGALLSSTSNVTHCSTLKKLRWVIWEVDLTFSYWWTLNISCPSKGVKFRVNWWISSHEWRRVLDRGTNLQSSRTFLFLPHHFIANWPRKVNIIFLFLLVQSIGTPDPFCSWVRVCKWPCSGQFQLRKQLLLVRSRVISCT